MQIGALTSRFNGDQWPLTQIVEWAGKTGIDCLEIERRQLDPQSVLERGPRDELLGALRRAKVGISALSFYTMDILHPEPSKREEARRTLELTIDAAEALGAGVVCTLAGAPLPGKSKMDTIRQDLPAFFAPLIERAAKKGIKIALENFFRTNIQHLDHWKALFEVLPQPNFGLNFDPSHLDKMEIDYMEAVREFAPRIFHTHAKDVFVDYAARRRIGVLDCADSRFCVPGTGRIAWGPYVQRLREVGFDGALSIEHEDRTLSSVDGFRIAAAHLRPLIVTKEPALAAAKAS
jgi:sugar phosphate isomerase/epimerase